MAIAVLPMMSQGDSPGGDASISRERVVDPSQTEKEASRQGVHAAGAEVHQHQICDNNR